MRVGISNLAWDVKSDELITKILNQYEIDAIDIAPMKYFQNLEGTQLSEVKDLKRWWNNRGVEITGLQGLLYGMGHLNMFSSDGTRDILLRHLNAIFDIAETIGAKKLVFGSPKNRDRLDLSDEEVMKVAISFFGRLGEDASKRNLVVCLEPNPVQYGANFMVSNLETASVVRAVNHPAIQMQYDTGSAQITGETSELEFLETADIIGHIHISEPNMKPIGTGETNHEHFRSLFLKFWPDRLITIEMLRPQESAESWIEKAIVKTLDVYSNNATDSESK